MLALVPVPALAAAAPVSGREAKAIATDAYAYAYPLVLMELSRRVMTNAGTGGPAKARAPMNQFAHLRGVPRRDVHRRREAERRHALLFALVRRLRASRS